MVICDGVVVEGFTVGNAVVIVAVKVELEINVVSLGEVDCVVGGDVVVV